MNREVLPSSVEFTSTFWAIVREMWAKKYGKQ